MNYLVKTMLLISFALFAAGFQFNAEASTTGKGKGWHYLIQHCYCDANGSRHGDNKEKRAWVSNAIYIDKKYCDSGLGKPWYNKMGFHAGWAMGPYASEKEANSKLNDAIAKYKREDKEVKRVSLDSYPYCE